MWALIFALLHVVWAMGWYVGLVEERAHQAFQQTWFLVYDLIVAGACVLAVAVALALVQPWGRRLPDRLISLLAWGGTGLLALRGGAGVVQVAYLAAMGRDVADPMVLWEVWFCLGAVLFGLSAWRFRRVSRPA